MNGGKDTGMVSALETAKVIFEDISILNVTSWQHWIACSRYDYCDGLIYIDPENQSFVMTKRYYVTGNFSKYIPYGAVRFEVKADDSDIMALGFEKDGKTVLIIINPINIKKSFSLSQKADVAVTDNDSNLREYTAENEIELTPQSVTTVIF